MHEVSLGYLYPLRKWYHEICTLGWVEIQPVCFFGTILCSPSKFTTLLPSPKAMESESPSVTFHSCDPMDCSPPGSSVHGDYLGKNTGLGCHFLLQGIFLTKESNQGLLSCRLILYHLSYHGSPSFKSISRTTESKTKLLSFLEDLRIISGKV